MPRNVRHSLLFCALCLAASVAGAQTADNAAAAKAAPAAQVPWPEPTTSAAEKMPLAPQSLLLDYVESGKRAIAVGENGMVLLSDDRSQWRQAAQVPTRATLTAVTAVGDKVWAVGRDGVIIASGDGGDTWTLQRSDPWRPPNAQSAGDDARHGAPLLDVLFTDATHGIAIGAYSLFLETGDGGTTWAPRQILAQAAEAKPADEGKGGKGESGKDGEGKSWTFSKEELKIGDEDEPHFNAIARTSDGSLLIAAERGSIMRSRDAGKTWQRGKLPYDGSMFGAIGFDGQRAMVFGLRGHVFETEDLGDTWREIPTATELSLLGGVKLASGGAALVGANGLVLLRRSGSESFKAGTVRPSGALAAILPVEGGAAFVVAGENGVARYQPKQ
ncbi:MAG TPA: YCF48-related protein [Tahibacter sp.]|nr:YCF48-related protein [Tahibacter sp.]